MIEIIPNWHPIFVHFTVALLLVSLAMYVLGLVAKCDQAMLVARWNLWLGAGSAAFTLAAGYHAFNTVGHDTPSHLVMIEHRNLALMTVSLLVPLVAWSLLLHKKAKAVGWSFVCMFLLIGAMLLSTAWHGAELVYRHGLGVMSMPDQDAHDHGAHDHGDSGHGAADGAKGHHSSLMDHHANDLSMDDMNMDDMTMETMHSRNIEADEKPVVSDHHHDDGHGHEHHH